jgi:hypothetical protein
MTHVIAIHPEQREKLIMFLGEMFPRTPMDAAGLCIITFAEIVTQNSDYRITRQRIAEIASNMIMSAQAIEEVSGSTH